MPLATDWLEILVPPVWSAILLVLLLVLALLLRRPLLYIFARLGVSRLSILGVDVEWITNQAEDAYASREMDAPGRGELRAFALLSVHLAPLLRNRGVLWVDDDPGNNASEAKLLRRLGVEVENELSTEAALARLAKNPGRFDLVISDWTRGGDQEAGPNLLRELPAAGIGLPVLLYVMEATPQRRVLATELGARQVTSDPDELLKQALVELSTAP